MQMTKQGAVKNVPDELAEFMAARGWKPADASVPAAPETPTEEPADEPAEDFVVWDDPEDENDVVDTDDVDDSTIDPAEEQS